MIAGTAGQFTGIGLNRRLIGIGPPFPPPCAKGWADIARRSGIAPREAELHRDPVPARLAALNPRRIPLQLQAVGGGMAAAAEHADSGTIGVLTGRRFSPAGGLQGQLA